MATLYNWSKYNNKQVAHTSYTTTTSYTDGSWVKTGSGTYTNYNAPTISGYSSYSFSSSSGYSFSGYTSGATSITVYSGSSTSVSKTTHYDQVGGNTNWDSYSKSATTTTTQTPTTYYTDEEGSLVTTFYDVYDAHTSGSRNADGYWYERGSVYNYDPTVSMNYNNGTSITSNLQIPQNNKSDFKFNIIGNDADTNDTIQYKVQLNGVDHSSYKGFLKNVSTSYTIPFNDLTLGNNTVTVFIKDSKGYSISQSFILRNKVPQNLSLHSVLDSETALGYGNASFADLQDLMPSGYTGALSMADYVDYLS